MKKTLALIVAIAMVLSLAVTAFVFTASANEDTDWNAYAEEKWEAVASAAATSVEFRADRYGSCGFIADGESIDFASAPDSYAAFPYSAGTASLEDGVLTLSNLVRKDGDETFAVIIGYGSLKVVIDGEYDGCIRNDEGTAGPLFVTGGEDGGFWTCPANDDDMDMNNFRTRNGLYIYGNIGFDIVGVLQFDTAVGEAILCPAEDSYLDAYGMELFMKKNSGYAEKLVVAGGATVTIDDGTSTTFKTDAPVTSIIVDGANLVWEDEFAECNGDDPALIPAITLKNGAKFTAATVYPGMEAGLLEKITCEDTATYYIGDELIAEGPGEDAGEGGEGGEDVGGEGGEDVGGEGNEDDNVEEDPTGFVPNKETFWEKYAEEKWAAEDTTDSYVVIGYPSDSDADLILDAENNAVDFAALVEAGTPFGCYKAGTATFANGVLTFKGLEYNEGHASSCNDGMIVGYEGAIKVVIDGCDFVGTIRNDWGADAAIYVQGVNGGSWSCGIIGADGEIAEEKGTDNLVRSEGDFYAYGDLTLDWYTNLDGVIRFDNADSEAVIAPQGGAYIKTNCPLVFTKSGSAARLVLAGGNVITFDATAMINIAGTASFPVVLGEVIVDSTKVEYKNNIFGIIETQPKYVLKNGAVLAVDSAFKTVEVTVEHGAYYVGGQLVKANAPAGGEGEGGDNPDTSAALVVPFVVMIALSSAAAVMIVRKKRA